MPIERIDMGTRVAGEKATQPDEFVTRSQLTDELINIDGYTGAFSGATNQEEVNDITETHIEDTTIHYPQTSIDHANLLNKGTNTHAQIDTHIATSNIHYLQTAINHNVILNRGTNTHAQIDTHIANNSIHFTEASINHQNILEVGANTHEQIDEHIDNALIHFEQQDIEHGNLINSGIKTHFEIDTHINDNSIHYLQTAINHNVILNRGTNTHAQIDSHIASTTKHLPSGTDGQWLQLVAGLPKWVDFTGSQQLPVAYVSPTFTSPTGQYFNTINAAIAAGGYSMIVVLPGTYNVGTLTIDGNLYLSYGANIDFDTITINNGNIFGDGVIGGSGTNSINFASAAYMECYILSNTNTTININQSYGNAWIKIHAKRAISAQVVVNGLAVMSYVHLESPDVYSVNAEANAHVEIKCNQFGYLESGDTSADIICHFIKNDRTNINNSYILPKGGGKITLQNGELIVGSDTGDVCCHAEDGTIRLENVTCRNLNTRHCVGLANATLISDNCTFISEGSFTIIGSGNENVHNYGSVANKTTDNVTVLVNTLTVDTNVI